MVTLVDSMPVMTNAKDRKKDVKKEHQYLI